MRVLILCIIVSSSLRIHGESKNIRKSLRIDEVQGPKSKNSTDSFNNLEFKKSFDVTKGSNSSFFKRNPIKFPLYRRQKKINIRKHSPKRFPTGNWRTSRQVTNPNPRGNFRFFQSPFTEPPSREPVRPTLRNNFDPTLGQNTPNQVGQNTPNQVGQNTPNQVGQNTPNQGSADPSNPPITSFHILINNSTSLNASIPDFYLIKYESSGNGTSGPLFRIMSPDCTNMSLFEITSLSIAAINSIFADPNCLSLTFNTSQMQNLGILSSLNLNEIVPNPNPNIVPGNGILDPLASSGSSQVISTQLTNSPIVHPTPSPVLLNQLANQPTLNAGSISSALQPLLFRAFDNILTRIRNTNALPNSSTIRMLQNLANTPVTEPFRSNPIQFSNIQNVDPFSLLQSSPITSPTATPSPNNAFVPLSTVPVSPTTASSPQSNSPQSTSNSASILSLIESSISAIIEYYRNINMIPNSSAIPIQMTIQTRNSSSSPISNIQNAQSQNAAPILSPIISLNGQGITLVRDFKLPNSNNSAVDSFLTLSLGGNPSTSGGRSLRINIPPSPITPNTGNSLINQGFNILPSHWPTTKHPRTTYPLYDLPTGIYKIPALEEHYKASLNPGFNVEYISHPPKPLDYRNYATKYIPESPKPLDYRNYDTKYIPESPKPFYYRNHNTKYLPNTPQPLPYTTYNEKYIPEPPKPIHYERPDPKYKNIIPKPHIPENYYSKHLSVTSKPPHSTIYHPKPTPAYYPPIYKPTTYSRDVYHDSIIPSSSIQKSSWKPMPPSIIAPYKKREALSSSSSNVPLHQARKVTEKSVKSSTSKDANKKPVTVYQSKGRRVYL